MLAVGINGFVANVAVASAGSPMSPNVTGELKPFTEVNCVVKVMDCAWTMLREVGIVVIKKSGGGLMDNVIGFVCVMPAELLVTVSGNVPVIAVGCVVMVNTVLAFGASGFVANAATAPVGNPKTLRFTGALNPLTEVRKVV